MKAASRTGLIAEKVGMTRIFADNGEHVSVTVLKMGGLRVVGQRTQARDGYTAVTLGYGAMKAKNVNRARQGQFAAAKVEAAKHVKEFRVEENAMLDLGAELSASHFAAGQYVDITGTSIGKGFAGVMKRWNFAGLRATHGVSVSHRSHGSTGQRQDPGKVFKNKKMAGHLGDEIITSLNIKVVAIDEAEGLIMIAGSVPGADGSIVTIRDAIKKKAFDGLPMPAGLKSSGKPAAAPQAQAEEAPADVEAEAPADTAQETEASPAAE